LSIPIEPLSNSKYVNRQLWQPTLDRLKALVREADVSIAIGKPSMFALELLDQFPLVNSLYDAMDNFSAFYSGRSRISLASIERRIVERVDCILASSEPLYSYWSGHATDVRLVRNGLNAERLMMLPEPEKSSGPKIMGYVGTISHWFDWDWVTTLAKIHASHEIRIVGPVFDRPLKKLPSNIKLLSVRDHASAIAEMSQFDVGLIPFKDNELTRYVDPIKYYEYTAIGIPILSSAFGEMKQRKNQHGVYIVEKGSDLRVLSSLALIHRRAYVDRLDFAQKNSWQARFGASGLLPMVR
jgi:hypothetical protein